MRTTLNCLFAAVVAVGCGGAKEAAAPPPADVAVANPVSCQTPGPVATVNQSQVRLQGGKLFNLTATVDLNASGVTSLNQLDFEWRSTDGVVVTQNRQNATWRAPDGPGLHFVYVLVSNRKGGYTERRIAISTEGAAGTPFKPADEVEYAPPASPEPNCFPFRQFARTAEFYGFGSSSGNVNGAFLGGDNISLPDVELFATQTIAADPNNPLDAVLVAKTNLRGEYKLNHVPPGDFDQPNVGNTLIEARMNLQERVPVGVDIATAVPESRNDIFGQPLGAPQTITGRVLLADEKTPCGTVNEFFAREVSGTAELLAANGTVLATRRLSDKGHYAFPSAVNFNGVSVPTNGARVRLKCEGSAAKEVAANTSAPTIIITDSRPPSVTNITSVRQDAVAGDNDVSVFLTPFSGGRSDEIPDSTFFLTYKGIDTALSACMYYRAIGAVKNCGPNGELIEPITMADWERKFGFGAFESPNQPTAKAKFINRVDLNLARDHDARITKVGEAATRVCNYLGAGGGVAELEAAIDNDPARVQTFIDASVDGMVAKQNLVACVIMDHSSTEGVNGGKPFTNFLIFGASGELLPRINLDGRGEKFVPGTCVICHGGDRYAGAFPSDGTGSPDIGTHLLPFIPPNYNYSSKTGLRRQDQEAAMHDLNQIIVQAGATQAAKNAIAGWYPGNSKIHNDLYIPPSWVGSSAKDLAFYQQVYKADCLGCHINGPARLDFDIRGNLVGQQDLLTTLNLNACGGGASATSSSYLRNKSMPNALRTFDLLWTSQNRAPFNGVAVDKMKVIQEFLQQYQSDVTSCDLRPTPIIDLQ
jgi:hypothetical protein